MRLFKTYTDNQISAPKNDIVCTESRFVQRQPVTLILREKIFSISGDDFSIKDTNNVEYFKCKGKVLSLRNRKMLYDLYQKPILNIQHKLMTLKRSIKIYEGEEETKQLAKISASGTFAVKKFIIEFYNVATEKNDQLEMKCDLLSFTCGIFYGKEKEGAPMIAKVTKKLDAKTLLTTQQNYFLEVAPGVDLAFLTAIAICFDEYKNEQRNRNNRN